MGRNREIKIRLADGEHAALMRRKGSMRLAAWMRESCLHGIPPTIPPANADTMQNLQRIGGNLNQIARRMNATDELDINELRSTISDLRATLAGASK